MVSIMATSSHDKSLAQVVCSLGSQEAGAETKAHMQVLYGHGIPGTWMRDGGTVKEGIRACGLYEHAC